MSRIGQRQECEEEGVGRKRTQVPASIFSRPGLSSPFLQLFVSKSCYLAHLEGQDARDHARHVYPLTASPRELGKESGIRGKRKAFLSKARALKNASKQLLPSCQPCYLAKVSKPDREKETGVFLTLGTGQKRVVCLGRSHTGNFLWPVCIQPETSVHKSRFFCLFVAIVHVLPFLLSENVNHFNVRPK